MRTTTRALAVLGLGLPLVVGGAGSASATVTPPAPLPPDVSSSRTSYQTANVSWTEVDAGPDDPVPGNWHLGNLYVQRSGYGLDVFGSIDDFQCDPGEVPGHGGHPVAPGEPEPAACESLGTRFLSASPTLAFTVDIPGGRLNLRGALIASAGGHDGPGAELGRPGVDITWKKAGSFYRYSRSETWEDDTRAFSSSTRGLGWQAAVSGTLGPMNFTDDADDASFGNAEQYTERTKSTSKSPAAV